MGVGGQHHTPATLPSGKRPSTLCEEGWVGPRVALILSSGRVHHDKVSAMVRLETYGSGHESITWLDTKTDLESQSGLDLDSDS